MVCMRLSTYNVCATIELDITISAEVLNTLLSLIAVMLSGGSGGVVFKVGLDGCKASEVLGVSLSVVGHDDCRASAVLNAYLDLIDKGGSFNILEVWH